MEILLLLLIKHAVIDLGLQGYISGTKLEYFGRKLFIHGTQHGIGTLLVLTAFVQSFELAFVLGVLDWILHWHIDYCKTQYLTRRAISIDSRHFWWIQAVDQILHYLTYFLIVLLVINFG
jgi:hypothetical protein